MRRLGLLFVALAAASCGGSAVSEAAEPPVERVNGHELRAARESQPASRAKTAPRKEERDDTAGLPQRCQGNRTQCLPPADWVERLCQDVHPDVALHLFRPTTPWRRLYMRKNAEPVNASGGMSLLDDQLRRGEEVIALRRRESKHGVQMSDTSGYDVLRWNGACATIHDGEYATAPLGRVLHAKVQWRELGLATRQKLGAAPRIHAAYEARRKHCRGRVVGDVTAECEEYDQLLTRETVRYVRSGAELPPPEKTP